MKTILKVTQQMANISKKGIVLLAIVMTTLASAQSQYEQGMQKALELWGQGKPNDASALFERIAAAEKNNWLPDYYVALVNTTESFNPANSANAMALIEKAQNAQDKAIMKSPTNAELNVMQAMIYTAMIVLDPMTNGMKYSPMVMEQYAIAKQLAPDNPRVVFCKADFEIGGARWTGVDTKPLCKEVERSIGLFTTFKPESQFSPKWGLDRAQETLKDCK
jgi:hypothetical protein